MSLSELRIGLLDSLRRKSSEIREIENQIQDAEAAVASSDSDTLSVKYELEKLSESLESLILTGILKAAISG